MDLQIALIQLIVAVFAFAGSAGIAWGVATAKLKGLEVRLAVVEREHKADHDILIEIKTKLDMLLQALRLELPSQVAPAAAARA